MKAIKSYPLATCILLAFIFGLYLCTLPVTVQSGDTGELVTNAFFLRVSHPPGYPLWHLLYHVPVRYLNLDNPFWMAAFVTSLIMLSAFGLLLSAFKKFETLGIVSVIATMTVIWRYAVLPDVFALHALFLTLVFLAFTNSKLLNKWWMIFAISLSVAHHHTIIFVFPLFLYALFESGITKKKIIYCLLFGLLSLSSYFLLLGFNVDDYGSWGMLKDFNDVIHHFLRRDYGTFTLATAQGDASWSVFFFNNFFYEGWSLIILNLYILYKGELSERKKPLILFSVTVLYFLIFGLLAKISLDVEGEAVFERFLIHPIFLVCFMTVYLVMTSNKKIPVVIWILVLINSLMNIYQNFVSVNYKNKFGVEDLIKNSLRELPENSVFFAKGDTFGFGTYYLHEVLGFRKDIKLIHPNWEFLWSSAKAKFKYSNIFNPAPQGPFIYDAINLEKYNLFSNSFPSLINKEISVTYYGVVFRYLPSHRKPPKFDCEKEYSWRRKPELKEFSRFEQNTYFDKAYGGCHYEWGLNLLKQGNLHDALLRFQRAVELSPFNALYQERVCYVLKQLSDPAFEACSQELDNLILNTHPQYYLNKHSL